MLKKTLAVAMFQCSLLGCGTLFGPDEADDELQVSSGEESAIVGESGGIHLRPAADTYVRSGSYSSRNYGSSSSVQVDRSDDGTQKQGFMRFTIGDVGVVTQARLRLYVINSSGDSASFVSIASKDWSEGRMTWSNRPSVTGTEVAVLKKTSRKTWVDLDVTSAVQANSVLSLAILGRSSDGVDFTSKEASSNRPELVIWVATANPTDAGTPVVDAGSQVNDAEPVHPDAEPVFADAQPAPIDGGSAVPDSGAALDAGQGLPDATPPPSSAFRFVAFGDTKSGRSTLAALSNQVLPHHPAFVIFPGDLESDGFTTSGMDLWKAAMNGNNNNGLFNSVFVVRGNHDDHLSGSAANWQGYFDMRSTATRVGAKSYSALSEDLTYSFDYGNAHFVGVDVPGGNSKMTSAALTWLDADLEAAKARGLTHAFLFWHGPIYPVGDHCCSLNTNITSTLNRHSILSATFHGHEHVAAYVHVDSARISNVTHEFEQFVSGAAGAGPGSCGSGRTDDCMEVPGFSVVDVSGRTYTVTWYKQGSTTPQRTFSFAKP